jgi:hypothetical protein
MSDISLTALRRVDTTMATAAARNQAVTALAAHRSTTGWPKPLRKIGFAALASASWGNGQIVGESDQLAGFRDEEQVVTTMSQSERSPARGHGEFSNQVPFACSAASA